MGRSESTAEEQIQNKSIDRDRDDEHRDESPRSQAEVVDESTSQSRPGESEQADEQEP